MITFTVTQHSTRPDTQIVEVFDGDRFLAAIYPDPDIPALRVVSKFLNIAGAMVDLRSTL